MAFPNPALLQGWILPGGAIAEVHSPSRLRMLSCTRTVELSKWLWVCGCRPNTKGKSTWLL